MPSKSSVSIEPPPRWSSGTSMSTFFSPEKDECREPEKDECRDEGPDRSEAEFETDAPDPSPVGAAVPVDDERTDSARPSSKPGISGSWIRKPTDYTAERRLTRAGQCYSATPQRTMDVHDLVRLRIPLHVGRLGLVDLHRRVARRLVVVQVRLVPAHARPLRLACR